MRTRTSSTTTLVFALALTLTACEPEQDAASTSAASGEIEEPAGAASADEDPEADASAEPADGAGSDEATQDDDDVDPISPRPLTERHRFTDDLQVDLVLDLAGRDGISVELDDASHIAVVEITIQPGAMFPWHTHPGPALASVVEGELVYIYPDDCEERPYPAGTAFVDPGGDNVHTAYNPSDTEETVVIVTFLGVPEDGPLTLPVEDDDEAGTYDAACGIDR